MADISIVLGKALQELEGQRDKLDRQIAAVQAVIGQNGNVRLGRPRKRRAMGAAARAAVSKRMKAYWAKRRKLKK